MSRLAFENFGLAAERTDNSTLAASRYLHQAAQEKLIVPDILAKLGITPADDCLDIGCGTGNILIPVSFHCRRITGNDNAKCLKVLAKRVAGLNNIGFLPGNFLDVKTEDRFDKIIIYSVIQYLADEAELFSFIDKAVSLLNTGGKILIGDIPNKSKADRYYATEQGKAWLAEFQRQRAAAQSRQEKECIVDFLQDAEKDNNYVAIDDALALAVLQRTRARGCNSYLVSQPESLPFGGSRDDIVIEKI
jgi:2-polyprenyl-3-methyl-5-hydroxy-6-metoxy-1,4-benzoquinol methylase